MDTSQKETMQHASLCSEWKINSIVYFGEVSIFRSEIPSGNRNLIAKAMIQKVELMIVSIGNVKAIFVDESSRVMKGAREG
jgi:hypothetical protein